MKNAINTDSGASGSLKLKSIDLLGNIELFESRNTKGTLTVGEKIHFNRADGQGCLLRICGFTKQQIKDMLNASFIDITLLKNANDNGTFLIEIQGTGQKRPGISMKA